METAKYLLWWIVWFLRSRAGHLMSGAYIMLAVALAQPGIVKVFILLILFLWAVHAINLDNEELTNEKKKEEPTPQHLSRHSNDTSPPPAP